MRVCVRAFQKQSGVSLSPLSLFLSLSLPPSLFLCLCPVRPSPPPLALHRGMSWEQICPQTQSNDARCRWERCSRALACCRSSLSLPLCQGGRATAASWRLEAHNHEYSQAVLCRNKINSSVYFHLVEQFTPPHPTPCTGELWKSVWRCVKWFFYVIHKAEPLG